MTPPHLTCPYCGNPRCEAEWTDIGVGDMQTGPYRCDSCHAVEIGPHDDQPSTGDEMVKGFYAPLLPTEEWTVKPNK